MKNEQKELESLKEIKELMERSVRFLSLSGRASLLIGILSIISVILFFRLLGICPIPSGAIPWNQEINGFAVNSLAIEIALGLLFSSILIALYFAMKNQKKINEPLWTKLSRNLVLNLFVPFIAGGILMAKVYYLHLPEYLPGLSLIFYGLGFLGISKYSFDELKNFGLIQVVLGIISVIQPAWGLGLWITGFGLLHLVYGIRLFNRYESH